MSTTKNRYLTIKKSSQANKKGNPYPDIMTFPIEKFLNSGNSKEHVVTQTDIDKFWNVTYKEYGTVYYDDIVLWFNNIDTVHELTPGQTIFLPSKKDLDRFIVRNST